MGGTKLYVLTCGSLWVEKAFFTHFGSHLDSGNIYKPSAFQLASTQYFIQHPEASILVDTGYHPDDYADRVGFALRPNMDGLRFKQEEDQNPQAQLGKIGVSLDDVDYVVISHLMLEHAGYLFLFEGKKAQILVQRKELEYAYANADRKRAPEPFHSWMYFKHHFDIPGLNYFLLDGDYTIVNGVDIFFMPGHTPGYQMVRVDLENEGPVFLSCCELESMYFGIGINAEAPGVPHPFSYSLGEELRNFRKIKALARKENGRIFFGHDQTHFDTLKKIPEYYD